MVKKIYSIRLEHDKVQKTLRAYNVRLLEDIHSIVAVSTHYVLVTFVGTKPELEND